MSKENLAQFLQQVQQDPSLQEKLGTASDKEQVSRLAVEFGKKMGLEFTTAEVLDSMTGELEESELDAVAGGTLAFTFAGKVVEAYWKAINGQDVNDIAHDGWQHDRKNRF